MNVNAPMGAIPLLTSLISVEWLKIQLKLALEYEVNPSQSCLFIYFTPQATAQREGTAYSAVKKKK